MNGMKPVFGQPLSPNGPWMISPFNVEMSPTAAVKRAGVFSIPLYVGLLTRLPDPDGVGAVEADNPGYLRQLIELTSRSASHVTIPRLVTFDLDNRPVIVGTGLFDESGNLEAYGVLRSSRISCRPASRLEFASHQIMIKRPGI